MYRPRKACGSRSGHLERVAGCAAASSPLPAPAPLAPWPPAHAVQEEVHRWEQLQSAGSGGFGRLPTAARGGSGIASRVPSLLPPTPPALAEQPHQQQQASSPH